MRDKPPQHLGYIFTLICFLLFSHLHIIHATEPQSEITIKESNSINIYDAYVPIDRNSDPSVRSIALSLPSYLREGFVIDDSTESCTNDEEKGAIVCTGTTLPDELHFEWDTHTIMEDRHCERLVGEKQTRAPWVGRYIFKRTGSFPWIRSILIDDLHVDDGSPVDTYADLTTRSAYVVLWSFGSLTGDSPRSVVFGTSTTDRPFLGSLQSIQGDPATLFIVDRNKHTAHVASAKLVACTIPDIAVASFDQTIEIEYFGEKGSEKVDTVSFAPLRFTYDTVESTFSPTSTPTPSSTPTDSPTPSPSPSPTTHVVIINPVTTTPTFTPTPSFDGASPTPNAASPTSGGASTPTHTPSPTPTSIASEYQIPPQGGIKTISKDNDLGSENEIPNSVKNAGGEVLGADTETPVTKSENAVVSIFLWMGGFLVLGIGALLFRRKTKHTISILLTLGIWFLGSSKVYAVTPQLLVKITDPKTYYARSMDGSIDLLTYPPNFYFEGVKPGGKVVLSSTPDGTGNISLGNGGFLTRRLMDWSTAQNFGIGPRTNTGNCYAAQNIPPLELPIQYFNSQNTNYNVSATFQGYCQGILWQVSTLYLVYFPPEPTNTPTRTPTPTITPSPTPTTVPPFLDLPWDYHADGLTFTEAALRMTSYFDHEYPTLSIGGMFDPDDNLLGYNGLKDRRDYSSHDGYDYANASKVSYGDDQLAAAAGTASYHYDQWSGHAIFIDHGNGFQTRYYHMQPDDLIVNTAGQTKSVSAGQKIGKVGYSGNVSPAGLGGAHIHFMVVFDKNHDGNFQDNIPDGLVDPFGWQGAGNDPWETFQFDYAGQRRTGMKSTYLWKTSTASQSQSVGSGGGEVKNEKVKLTIPPLVLPDLLQFFIRSAPRTSIDGHTESVGSIADITAVDGGGIAVKHFTQPINISFTYSKDDALYYDPDRMSIYSSPDGAIWQKEQTLIDHDTRTATASVDHLTYFALMGERRDTTAPRTTVQLSGQGNARSFHSDVIVELHAEDPVEGSTIDYTLFKLDEGEWGEYTAPVIITTEGAHTLQYFSADKSGNVESAQTVEFTIDQTIPEIAMRYDLITKDFIFSTDADASINEPSTDSTGVTSIAAQDTAGNTHEMRYRRTVGDALTTLEVLGDEAGFYAISNAEGGRYEYFQSDDVTRRIIPSGDGRLQINANDEITENVASPSLHIKTHHGTLEIDE